MLELGANVKNLSDELKGAVIGFVILLSKGLLDDERWEWDIDQFDWHAYQSAFSDASILRTTLAVFMNNLQVDELGTVANYLDSRYRAFQYFRALTDKSYPLSSVTPPFTSAEIEEPDWRIWEA